MKQCKTQGCTNNAVTIGKGMYMEICVDCADEYYKTANKRYYQSTRYKVVPRLKMSDKKLIVNTAMLVKSRNPEQFCKLVERYIKGWM